MFQIFAWPAVGVGFLAAVAWAIRRWKRQRLFRQANSLAALHRLSWADFERVVGEAYRHQGWSVDENGLGGADGGVDLFLRRGMRRCIVQVKHWRNKVGAPVVREQYGLLHHHKAHEVHVVALGGFTAQAEEFARGKPMVLVDGIQLLHLMGGDLPPPSAAPATSATTGPRTGRRSITPAALKPPSCPICQGGMVQRTRRADGALFWGCSRYPLCSGTQAISVR